MNMQNEFDIETLSSGIGLTGAQLLSIRKIEGYEFLYKEKLTGILPEVYVFRKWSSKMNRYIFLHHVWDYYEEIIISCKIYFDSSKDVVNNPRLNEEFMDKYIRGYIKNVGREEDAWRVNGVMYTDSDPRLLEALRQYDDSEHFEKTNEFYPLDRGDYLMYDKEANEYGAGLEVVNAKYYNTEMLSMFERRDAWTKELQRKNMMMFASPKYHR